ncbi:MULTISPECIES: hypothetical protein [unclassified Burkholderia]|uniref:hypothetical protein n=1 Tax=unclassified Burkholderia TaxID=2613784 RepID=UPI0011AE2824|nr:MULTISPECIES: hypothetical protein [unclassified Burkholderia]
MARVRRADELRMLTCANAAMSRRAARSHGGERLRCALLKSAAHIFAAKRACLFMLELPPARSRARPRIGRTDRALPEPELVRHATVPIERHDPNAPIRPRKCP